ncbi:hypothetical protein AUJ69_01665 [Candidatus Woesearchaeota archaeon CG1_02_47_18]|nr:MAG: hypothetical protein AUJ69_01665 [Candidatus Woesearchaeota archaeon CG1_02_47_18]HII29993.1 hypothetical protein [Candidatus Woesearchaeota archaeon]
MRITPRLIQDTVKELIGEDAVPIVTYLKGKRNISEFKIAEGVNLEVNRVRHALYRLHEKNLVTYYRKKDRKKGWYISYWTFNPREIIHIKEKDRRESIDLLQERLEREESSRNAFFICPSVCVRMDFDSATESGFRCPECGQILTTQDNAKTIMNIRKRIEDLESGFVEEVKARVKANKRMKTATKKRRPSVKKQRANKIASKNKRK